MSITCISKCVDYLPEGVNFPTQEEHNFTEAELDAIFKNNNIKALEREAVNNIPQEIKDAIDDALLEPLVACYKVDKTGSNLNEEK